MDFMSVGLGDATERAERQRFVSGKNPGAHGTFPDERPEASSRFSGPLPPIAMIKNLLRLASLGLIAACTLGQGLAASIDLKATASKIDQLVAADLAKHKLQPNALTTDEVFVRRVYLDVVGRIPTLKETNEFLQSTDKDKRSKLIDTLIGSEGYVQNFFNYWSDVLRLKSQMIGGGQSASAAYAYQNWLKDSLRDNKPFDKMVREMVTADGKTYENGAVGFYIRDYNMPLDNMAVTTQIFLGTSMVCAQCHNHPFDKWTMMDYYQMAAHTYGMTGTNGLTNPLLAQAMYGGGAPKSKKAKSAQTVSKMDLPDGMQRKDIGRAMSEILRPLRYNTVLDESHRRALKLPQDYKYDDAKPKATIEPVIPAAFSKDGKIVKGTDSPVDAYASWMTSKSNPRFTTVIANRLWRKVMGLGLIEPVDEITDSTVPSNPQLMTFLEETMKSVNYDMKEYLRVVLNSETYQRAAHNKDVELSEPYHFQGPVLRRMSAEQIWDSMVALYKPSPDQPSVAQKIAGETALRRIEWMDRALNSLPPEELKACAVKVAQKQRELADEVRKAQETLTEANKNKDEDAIRAAKRAVSSQRKRLDEAVEEIVYDTGFKRFAELARQGKLDEFSKDEEFAREVAAVVKAKNGKDLHIDEALGILAKQQRTRAEEIAKQRKKADAERFNVKLKSADNAKQSLASWESFRDTIYVRASDIRSPAPNGHFLREFGQSDREIVENASEDASVGQALMLLNGKTFSHLMNPYTAVARAMAGAKEKGSDALIDTVYLALMSRKATDAEKAVLRPVADNADATDRGDVLWTVLNTRQFFFIQ